MSLLKTMIKVKQEKIQAYLDDIGKIIDRHKPITKRKED